MHQGQHRTQKRLGNDLQHDDHPGGKQQALPGASAQARFVPRAEALGNLDGKALGQAHGKAQHRPVQPSGGGYRGQRRHALHASHHQRVHQAVQLLEQVARQNGQAEQKNVPGRAAVGHVSGLG